ncbi:exopolysaccharide biosynthesis protein [Azospirillum halopraeferens]|uniref:exopolysaccharide biosynthesis protein n=1 Tax=Azospirillum halopraeferens TaxID=34010 RepID=UPI001FE00DBA|nr:exopolysaccharide biosynthesis protein [Azospirillum halopraeferens]
MTSDIRPACEPEGARKRASEVLDDFLAHEHGERIVLGDLLAILGDRAFGALLLLLAIPNVLPVPGLSTATGLVTALVAAQMALGRRAPWLPRRLAAVGIDRAVFLKVVARAHPHVRRIERRLLRPRLPALTSPLAERAVGLVVVVLAVVLSLPIVFGNQPPALAIALIALGLIEKDGAFVLAGLVASVLALGVVLAVVTGLFHGVTFLFNGLFT